MSPWSNRAALLGGIGPFGGRTRFLALRLAEPEFLDEGPALHAGDVLEHAGDARGEAEVRPQGLARLPDPPVLPRQTAASVPAPSSVLGAMTFLARVKKTKSGKRG